MAKPKRLRLSTKPAWACVNHDGRIMMTGSGTLAIFDTRQEAREDKMSDERVVKVKINEVKSAPSARADT